jgi:glutamyl-Q tRNA(Asp) synthetase
MANVILGQLAALGLHSDEPVQYQSQRSNLYQQALDQLIVDGLAYPCICSRKDIEAELARQGAARTRHGELVYPGTCRHLGVAAGNGQPAAWRLRTDVSVSKWPEVPVEYQLFATQTVASINTSPIEWYDRHQGAQQQNVEKEVGDFPLKRADGCFTYQLAVAVDDAAQGITHVVRGEDLADNTARQIALQRALGLPTPAYLHTPLVRGANGEKLSKQNGATALDTRDRVSALNAAALALGLSDQPQASDAGRALATWMQEWRALYNPNGERYKPH